MRYNQWVSITKYWCRKILLQRINFVASQAIISMENETATVITDDGITEYRKRVAITALRMLAQPNALKFKNVKLRDLKLVLGLTGRTAAECWQEFQAKNA